MALSQENATNMGTVLFWDPACQRPYDLDTIRSEATGGTEASLSRIADSLGAFVIQHNRVETRGPYRPPAQIPGITHIVINRDAQALTLVHGLYPNARLFLWVHQYLRPGNKLGDRLARQAQLLRDLQVTIVCVSEWQRRGVTAVLEHAGVAERVPTCTIYNPIDDALTPDASEIDLNKLVFFSAQNRGLLFALDAFAAARRRIPELRLIIGNPGYKVRPFWTPEGVTNLGPQPQARIHAEVRTALCTFFPNFTNPETFGLVFAESMALGTPVLTHDCGAAAEVIADPAQIMPIQIRHRVYELALRRLSSSLRHGPARLAARTGLFDAYTERVIAWRAGARPRVGPNVRFALSTVSKQWRELLSS